MSTFGYPAGDKSVSELGAPPSAMTEQRPDDEAELTVGELFESMRVGETVRIGDTLIKKLGTFPPAEDPKGIR